MIRISMSSLVPTRQEVTSPSLVSMVQGEIGGNEHKPLRAKFSNDVQKILVPITFAGIASLGCNSMRGMCLQALARRCPQYVANVMKSTCRTSQPCANELASKFPSRPRTRRLREDRSGRCLKEAQWMICRLRRPPLFAKALPSARRDTDS